MFQVAACRSTVWFTCSRSSSGRAAGGLDRGDRKLSWLVGKSWQFSIAQNLEDAQATLLFIRAPDNANKLSIDRNRIVIGGYKNLLNLLYKCVVTLYKNFSFMV